MDGGAAVNSSSTIRRAIKVLPPLVANQIAAGEVVERPASVVKELVENALDAGAATIKVEIEQGGIELIRVTDDGCGIPQDELRLALSAHATSKITDASELEAITTKGFRGEALASIASVSRVIIRSRTADQEAAASIDGEGDTIQPVRPAAGPVGTSITVRNLFFNTPARRKFLKTPATEQGRCSDVVRELAIAHPGVGFALLIGERRALEVPADQTPRDRVIAVLGEELADQMIEVTADAGERMGSVHGGSFSLWGLIGMPALARVSASAQHVTLNGRIIRDKTIQHAIREAYRGLIEPGRFPTVVLLLEMDPRGVDVNVHPAKTEVRFRDSSLVHSLVYRTIRDALQRADLTAAFSSHRSASERPWPQTVAPFGTGLVPSSSGSVQNSPGGSSPGNASEVARAFADRFTAPVAVQDRLNISELAANSERHWQNSVSPAPDVGIAASLSARAHPSPAPLVSIAPTTRPLQVHNSYLVTQDDRGMVIIDQHALHERVMFEKLLGRVTGSEGGTPLESQRLLMPAVIDADSRRLEALDSCKPLFERIGLVAEQIGPSQIAVSAFPTFLFDRNVEVESFLAEVLDKAAAEGDRGFSGGPSSEQALHEVLDMMACKAAVKAGNALSDLEIAELLSFREQTERAASCPHGRPTSVRLTIKDLERLFHRA